MALNSHPSAIICSNTFLAISSVVARSAARPEVQTHLNVQEGMRKMCFKHCIIIIRDEADVAESIPSGKFRFSKQ